MSGTWKTGWAVADTVTAAEFRKSMGSVDDQSLAAPATSIDVTSIPAGYAHLRLIAYLRGDGVGANDNAIIRFNADSGANYDYEIGWYAGTSSPVPAEGIATTTPVLARIPNASSPANVFGMVTLDIAFYAGTSNHKIAVASFANKLAASTGKIETGQATVAWRSFAAINEITLIPSGGSNFVAGSRVTTYVEGS